MDTAKTKHLAVITLLLAITLATTLLTGKPSPMEESPVNDRLPDTIGNWTGFDLLYCQNIPCLKVYRSDELKITDVCSNTNCGGRLDYVSPGEKALLPSDTKIFKKLYENPAKQTVLVTVVITGTQRSSIHRPEWCLTGQGFRIDSTETFAVSAENKDLKVALMNLSRQAGNIPSARIHSAFAYWFIGKDFETPDHTRRLMMMAWDNIARGVQQRWAYVSLLTSRADQSDQHLARLRELITLLHPHLLRQQ